MYVFYKFTNYKGKPSFVTWDFLVIGMGADDFKDTENVKWYDFGSEILDKLKMGLKEEQKHGKDK